MRRAHGFRFTKSFVETRIQRLQDIRVDDGVLKTTSEAEDTGQELSEDLTEFDVNNGTPRTPPTTLSDTNSSLLDCGHSQPETRDKTGSWYFGRRIIELGHLTEQMVCTDCGMFLHLQNIVSENRHEYGSHLMIECECGMVRDVTTGKTHRVSKTGPPVFDVNSKAALAMMHSGIGHTQVTSFMAAIEIEGSHHRSMKKREKEVEPHVLSIAKESCHNALVDEMNQQDSGNRLSPEGHEKARSRCTPEGHEKVQTCSSSSNDFSRLSPEGQEKVNSTPCIFKYDMGWQKRGSGRSYNSKSGVGTLIGNTTGKICAYGIKVKDCKLCSYHINKGQTPPKHDCKQNWSGSSKGIESSVAVDLIKEVEKENAEVAVLIMDDDTTTMARIRDHIEHPVYKWSDINHTKKHLGKSLYCLQKKHKHFSTNGSIQYLQKCFSYAVAQNKENSDGLKGALLQIVPHAFGDHRNCNVSWCGYLTNPFSYTHKSLAHGHDLTGDKLRADLNCVFNVFVSNVEKIAPAGSTKDVESFNNMIASKAPKQNHYSASSSLHNRVDCAVAQKNLGSSYISQVNSLMPVSPGIIYKKHADRKDKVRKRRLEFENTIEFKTRRIERKLGKKSENKMCEMREGITYQSAFDLASSENSNETVEIPAPQLSPMVDKIEFPDKFTYVFCDIETTSLSKKCDILQIAATSSATLDSMALDTSSCTDNLSQYILPIQAIAPGASAVTHLVMHCNTLFFNGDPVVTVPLRQALVLFLAWLEERKPCVLIGHNFRQFDCPRILYAFDKCSLLSSLSDCVIGIVDSLPLFREIYPDEESHKQEQLVLNILHEHYSAHNAKDDVSSLQRLVTYTMPSASKLAHHSATLTSMINKYRFDNEADINPGTLCILFETKVLSKNMCMKIARSGLQLKHLKAACDRDCLRKVLTEKSNGKVRVSSCKRIIQNLLDYFTQQEKN